MQGAAPVSLTTLNGVWWSDAHDRWEAENCGVTLQEARACRTWDDLARLGCPDEDAYSDGGGSGKRGPLAVTVHLGEDVMGSHTITIGAPVPECEPESEWDDEANEVWRIHDGSGGTVADEDDLPAGDDDGHAWRSPHALVSGCQENPGVYGKGGGVTIHEVCVRCGLHRHTDTWDQSWTGTGEPVETVRHARDG